VEKSTGLETGIGRRHDAGQKISYNEAVMTELSLAQLLGRTLASRQEWAGCHPSNSLARELE
jgi:hypothetical protein